MSIKSKLFAFMNNQPYGTDELVNIRNIIIPSEFKERKFKPQSWKMIKCRKYFCRYGRLDSPIEVAALVNENGKANKFYLTDKYTRMLVALEMGLTKVPVKYIEIL